MENTEKIVLTAGDKVKHSVDDQIGGIQRELRSLLSESSKQAKSVQETYELALASMESFHTYSRELLDKGGPSDITRAAGQLHDRASELLANDVTAIKYCPPHITFTPGDVTQMEQFNLIGKLNVNTENQPGM